MKKIFIIKTSLFILFLIPYLFTPSYAKAPNAVNYVNPSKFSGLWYEIARTYNFFEENCVAPTVEYNLISNDEYKITNRCFEKEIGAKLIKYEGRAKPLTIGNMSQIEKTYFWIFSKDYRVIYLDNYESAVIADKTMEHIWIMNRKPNIDEEKLKTIISMLENYLDTSKLIFPKQDKNGKYK